MAAAHLMIVRIRDWLFAPLAFLYFLTYPVWWLLGLPNGIRAARLDAQSTRDVGVALYDVISVRWYTRGSNTMASGHEEDEYFVIVFANGRRLVVHDSFERALANRLEVRGLLPEKTISLGTAPHLEFIGWFWATAITLAVYVIVRLLRC